MILLYGSKGDESVRYFSGNEVGGCRNKVVFLVVFLGVEISGGTTRGDDDVLRVGMRLRDELGWLVSLSPVRIPVNDNKTDGIIVLLLLLLLLFNFQVVRVKVDGNVGPIDLRLVRTRGVYSVVASVFDFDRPLVSPSDPTMDINSVQSLAFDSEIRRDDSS
jgi:hypothetical protein